MSTDRHGRTNRPDIPEYIRAHRGSSPSIRPEAAGETAYGESGYGRTVRTTDSVLRAKVEHEALMTAVLAVLICWIPYATIFTLVAGAGRWMTASRGWGGNAGAGATVFSALIIVAWTVFLLVA
jgi:hypothetical protein